MTLGYEAEVIVDNIAAALPDIKIGDIVSVLSTTGPLRRVAVTGVVRGRRFPVVWVCAEKEWEIASRLGREPDAVPWPAEDVRLDD